mmetsp:Transcript_60357/g.134639  ORF Transcript_60357/g.134639 Transcript_60357/m.134639 type:complete len:185 (-) Transcript_60357:44-598(-)
MRICYSFFTSSARSTYTWWACPGAHSCVSVGAGLGGDWVKTIFGNRVLARLLAYLLFRHFVDKLGDTSRYQEKELRFLKPHFGEDLSLFGAGLVRGMSYFLHQWWQVGYLAGCKEANHYVDLQGFDPAIPVHVHVGTEDNICPEQSQQFLGQLPHGRFLEYEGTHGGFPLHEIIAGLLDAASRA